LVVVVLNLVGLVGGTAGQVSVRHVNGWHADSSGVVFHSHVPEVVLDELVLPSTRVIARGFEWMRWIQRGSVQRYLLYILLTLLFFLVRR